MDKAIIGLTQEVAIKGKSFTARIDSGATHSSLDERIAKELKLGPVVRHKKVRSANGMATRPIIEASIRIANREVVTAFTLANRTQMKYQVLIGQNTLKMIDVLIDPQQP